MFEYLFSIDWHGLETAYGHADEVPDQLLRLNHPNPNVRKLTEWELYGNIYHQGTIYEAAFFAIPFLVELEKAGEFADKSWISNYIDDLNYEDEDNDDSDDFDADSDDEDENIEKDNTLGKNESIDNANPDSNQFDLKAFKKLCYSLYNNGYTSDAFAQIRKSLDLVRPNSIKTYEIPDLKNFKIGYMGNNKEEMQSKIKEFKAEGYWDMIIEDRLYPDQIVIFIPRNGPNPKPEPPISAKKDLDTVDINKLIAQALEGNLDQKYSEVYDILINVLKRDPTNFIALHTMVETKLNLNKAYEALTEIKTLLIEYPYEDLTFYDSGRVNHSLKRHWMAIQDFEKALMLRKEETPEIYNLIAISAFSIGDFDRMYTALEKSIDSCDDNAKLVSIFLIFMVLKRKYVQVITQIQKILEIYLPKYNMTYSAFIQTATGMKASLGLHLQNAGMFNVNLEKEFTDFLGYLNKLLIDKPLSRLKVLELIYFANKFLHKKKPLDQIEFSDTAHYIAFMDQLISFRSYYWMEINEIAWAEYQGPLVRQIVNPYNYNSQEIANYLVNLGSRLHDEKIRCFGLDLVGAGLVKSNNKEDLLRAKSIYEEIQRISKDYYTPKNYEQVLKKLENIKP